MNLKVKYQELTTLPYGIETIEKIKEFNNLCVINQNHEYYYLSNLLIIDNLTELNRLDEALNIIIQDITDFDTATFKYIYVSYLDRIIYLYIKKRNYKVAYRYIFEKRKFINNDSRDEVNRWYLEVAYIYAEIGQKTKALNSLKAILENLPNEELLAHTLSNITKLYIDQDMLVEAKNSLNECLKIITDEDGLNYCNYLLAQILEKEGRNKDAIQLYEEIFSSGVTNDYISIGIDYLNLMISMGDFDKAKKFITILSPLVEEIENLDIKKNLYFQQLRLILTQNNIKDGNQIIKEIKEVDEKIIYNDIFTLNEIFDEENEHESYIKLNGLNNKIIHLIESLKSVFSLGEIRDVFMDFSKKLESIFKVDEITFGIYDKIIVNQKYDQIVYFNYKNTRLYEKLTSYDDLKNTLVEMMITTNKEVSVDLSYNRLSINDVFTKKPYVEGNINYVLGIPYFDETGLYFSIIFKSKNVDITATENAIILRIAASLLERSLVTYFLNRKASVDNFVLSTVLKNSNHYYIYHYGNKVVIDERLATIIGYETTSIDITKYMELMPKQDAQNYSLIDFNAAGNHNLSYTIKVNNVYHHVNENIISSYQDGEFFYVGTLALLADNQISYDDEIFEKKIEEFKNKTSNIEFKFSLIRIKAESNQVNLIEEVFNLKPYFLSDNDYIILLENEVNQKTIDKYLNNLNMKASVVRYPRDLVNIDDIVKYSKISLDNSITYFTEEVYHKYLKKVTINNLVKEMLNTKIDVLFNQVNDKTLGFEVTCNIRGTTLKDNLRKLLEEENLVNLEQYLYNNFKAQDLKKFYYIYFTSKSLNQIINNNLLKPKNNIIYIVDQFDKKLKENLLVLKQEGLKFILDYKILENFNIYELVSLGIYGISISEGIDNNLRKDIMLIASTLNVVLYTAYKYPDFDNCIYRTDVIVEEN